METDYKRLTIPQRVKITVDYLGGIDKVSEKMNVGK
jgi:hypothetical protein